MRRLAHRFGILFSLSAVFVILAACTTRGYDPLQTLAKCDLSWESPSRDAWGTMPAGNGDIGLNVWVEDSGDLLFYIGKTDLWDDNSRLLKLGRIRFRMNPNLFRPGGRFLQTLRLRDAAVEVRYGEGEGLIQARVWVDAHHPVIHVQVEGERPDTVDAGGKIVMEPTQALETWWDCRNPMPEIAGILAVTERLLAHAGDKVGGEEKALWERLRSKMPDLPTQEVEGKRMLAPAEKFATKSNIENPELYAVFPYRRVALGRPGVELAVEALNRRLDKGNFGWRQEDIFMAYLGLAEEARQYIVGRARAKHEGSRFPAFWGPNYDWVPDQDHGGVLLKALQAMLMQTDGRKVFLLPAWPKDWDADFKLRAPYRTIVSGRVENGKVKRLSVEPAGRKEEIVILGAE